MNIQEVESKNLYKKFEVKFLASEIQTFYDIHMDKAASNVKIAGYRKGKVPKFLIENRHGKEIYQDVIQEQIQVSLKEISENRKIFGNPKIGNLESAKGKDLTFTVEIEEKPEYQMPTLTDIQIEKPIMKDITEEELERGKVKIAKEFFKPKNVDDKAQHGHLVTADVTIYLDGKVINEEKILEYIKIPDNKNPGEPSLQNDSNGTDTDSQNIDDKDIFDRKQKLQLLGCNKDQEVLIKNVKLHNNMDSKYLNNKSISALLENGDFKTGADAKITIRSIQQVEFDQDNISDEELSEIIGCSTEEVKEKVSLYLKSKFDGASKNLMKIKLFDELEKILDFEVPKTVIDSERKALRQEIEKSKHESELLSQKNEEEMDEYINQYSLRRVRIGLFLSDYAKHNNIEISDKEFKNALVNYVSQFGSLAQRILDMYLENKDMANQFFGSLLEEKATQNIVSRVSYDEQEYSLDSLEQKLDKIASQYV